MSRKQRNTLDRKAALKAHLRAEHDGIVRNFGQQFHRASLRDLTVAHGHWHHLNGGSALVDREQEN